MTTTEAAPARLKRRELRARRARNFALVAAFVGPALLLYFTFLMWPLIQVGVDSTFSWTGSRRREFVGLDNFETVFNSQRMIDEILNALQNNALFFLGTMLAQNVLGLVLAILLHKFRRAKLFFQTLISLPYLMNPLVVGYIWIILLNPSYGPLAWALEAMNLSDWVFPWLADPYLALPLTILINAWQWIGFPMLLFGAAIAGIPQEINDAAAVDGANGWQRFTRITLPLLTPVITSLTVLTFISCFNAFSLQLAIGGVNGGPGGVVDVLGLVFYRTAFGADLNSIGLASSLAVMTFILVFGGALLLRKALRTIEERAL